MLAALLPGAPAVVIATSRESRRFGSPETMDCQSERASRVDGHAASSSTITRYGRAPSALAASADSTMSRAPLAFTVTDHAAKSSSGARPLRSASPRSASSNSPACSRSRANACEAERGGACVSNTPRAIPAASVVLLPPLGLPIQCRRRSSGDVTTSTASASARWKSSAIDSTQRAAMDTLTAALGL